MNGMAGLAWHISVLCMLQLDSRIPSDAAVASLQLQLSNPEQSSSDPL